MSLEYTRFTTFPFLVSRHHYVRLVTTRCFGLGPCDTRTCRPSAAAPRSDAAGNASAMLSLRAAVQVDVDLCPGLLPPRLGLLEVVDLRVRRHA